jgi:hypothetical protein
MNVCGPGEAEMSPCAWITDQIKICANQLRSFAHTLQTKMPTRLNPVGVESNAIVGDFHAQA